MLVVYCEDMKRYVQLQKEIGQTPLQAITAWKAQHPRYTDVPASYAGRLDPMASGILLVLLGEECKRQNEYTKLDKEYDIEVLLDVGSDTGDILGIVSGSTHETYVSKQALSAVLRKELGTHTRSYPAYSSKTVDGKPLFLYALEGKLNTITLPMHDETIRSIKSRGSYALSSEELHARITSLLALAPISDEPSKALGADFRIHAVRNSWTTALLTERSYTVLKLRVRCGSGTYMRSLAGRIGAALSTSALALSIHRRRIIGVPWF